MEGSELRYSLSSQTLKMSGFPFTFNEKGYNMLYVKKISTNLCLEIVSMLSNSWNSYFTLDISLNKNQCHAGFHFLLCILKWQFEFNIFDIRHWDYKNNCWEVYIENDEEAKPKKEFKNDKNEWNDQIGIGA